MTRRPGVPARCSVMSLAALARCLRQSNAENNLGFLWPRAISPMRLAAAAQDEVLRAGGKVDTREGEKAASVYSDKLEIVFLMKLPRQKVNKTTKLSVLQLGYLIVKL